MSEIDVRGAPKILGGLLDRFVDCINEADSGPFDEAVLGSILDELVDVQASLASITQRPYLGVAKRQRIAAEEFRNFVSGCIDVLDADTILGAQLSQRSMQSALDRAAKAIGESTEITKVWKKAEDSELTLSDWVLQAVALLTDSADLQEGILDFDRLGARLLKTHFGEDCPQGLGPSVVFIDFFSRIILSEDQLRVSVRELVQFLSSFTSELAAIASNADWKKTWGRQATAIWKESERARALFAIDVTDEDHLWTWLQTCRELEEGVIKHGIATLQVASGVNNTFDAILANGVPNLVEWAVSKGLSVADPLKEPVRNASAHRDFSISGNAITLTPLKPSFGTAPTYTSEEFVDLALSIVESAMGMWLGVTIALSQAGIEPMFADPGAGIPANEMVLSLLGMGGWRDSNVEIVGEHMEITTTGDREPLLFEMASLSPSIPDSISTVRATFKVREESLQFVIPMDALRKFQEAEGDKSGMALVIFQRLALFNGVAIETEDLVRKIFVNEAVRIWSDMPVQVARKELVKLIKEAEPANDPTLIEALRQFLRFANMSSLGLAEGASGSIGIWAESRVAQSALSRRFTKMSKK